MNIPHQHVKILSKTLTHQIQQIQTPTTKWDLSQERKVDATLKNKSM